MRHRATAFRRPVPPHGAAAFEAIRTDITRAARPVILDTGCGVGMSSARIAEAYPDHLIIGLDKSAHRLAKAKALWTRPNTVFHRIDLMDFYPLAAQAGMRVAKQMLLYPNPWPKAAHLARRWHGSPIFPLLADLGGDLELRTNWPLYGEEFTTALTLCGHTPSLEGFTLTDPAEALTPFERKYAESGHSLVRVTCTLSK